MQVQFGKKRVRIKKTLIPKVTKEIVKKEDFKLRKYETLLGGDQGLDDHCVYY